MLYRYTSRIRNQWHTNIFAHDNIKRLINVDLLIVDEFSMMNSELLDRIMDILQHPDLLCGNLGQLPTVSGDSIVFSTWFQHFQRIQLTTSHRTETNELLDVINDFYTEDDMYRTNMLSRFINSRIPYDTLSDVAYIYPLNSQY